MGQVFKGIVATLLLGFSIHNMMGSVGVDTGDYASMHGVSGGLTSILLSMVATTILIWAFMCAKK